jgi:cytoskeletal protein CcmA (bactofilin family)
MSVVGPSLVIKGDLEAGEDLLIEGRVEGTIKHTAEQLLIGQRGSLKADIRARNVIIEGEVEGDVYGSDSVSIRETAKVRGNIFTPKISISEGAHFKGGIDMDVENVQKH